MTERWARFCRDVNSYGWRFWLLVLVVAFLVNVALGIWHPHTAWWGYALLDYALCWAMMFVRYTWRMSRPVCTCCAANYQPGVECVVHHVTPPEGEEND